MTRFIFIIGAHKCGTTSVAEFLGSLNGVSLAKNKEPNHFVKSDSLGKTQLASYQRLFAAGAPVHVDASTNYSKCRTFPGTARRIASFAPDARIVYLTRDPIARMRSAWRQHLDESAYPIARNPIVAVQTDSSLLDATMYQTQLEEYETYFDPSCILTLSLESLTADAEGSLQRICAFADLDPGTRPELPHLNHQGHKGQDPAAFRLLTDSRLGKTVLDQARASALRPALAKARRRFLHEVPSDAADAISWETLNVGDADRLRADCQRYHRHWPDETTDWASLAE